ncbi:MAG: hypothetical protein Q7T40_02400, partial [Methylobacter sp.]|nr:hypothetical protein [Methylobacter sp.]
MILTNIYFKRRPSTLSGKKYSVSAVFLLCLSTGAIAGEASAPAHAPRLRPAGEASAPAHAPRLRPVGEASAPAHGPYLRPAGEASAPAHAP